MASTQTDEDRRKLLKPKVSPEEVLSILNEFYISDGQNAQVTRELDSYDDANFLVKIDGEKALLKIHNGVESEKYIKVHSGKRIKFNDGRSAGDGNIIDLHTAIFEHLAKPEFDVTTCTTIHNTSQDAVSIKELPVRPTGMLYDLFIWCWYHLKLYLLAALRLSVQTILLKTWLLDSAHGSKGYPYHQQRTFLSKY